MRAVVAGQVDALHGSLSLALVVAGSASDNICGHAGDAASRNSPKWPIFASPQAAGSITCRVTVQPVSRSCTRCCAASVAKASSLDATRCTVGQCTRVTSTCFFVGEPIAPRACRPLQRNAARQVFAEAQRAPGKVAGRERHCRHQAVPHRDHRPALARRPVAPIRRLRTDEHEARDVGGAPRERRERSADAVADVADRQPELERMSKRRIDVEHPVREIGDETTQALRARPGGATVVEGKRRDLAFAEPLRKATVKALRDTGRGGKHDDAARRALGRVPGGGDRRAIFGAQRQRFARDAMRSR